MGAWIRASRAVVMVIGVVALLLAGGNLATGGGSLTDPVMPGGVLLGLLAIGAAAWTTDRNALRAVVVWLGVIGIVAGVVMLWANTGDMATRDLYVYIGIPAAIVLVAAAGVAVGRVRAGALGARPAA